LRASAGHVKPDAGTWKANSGGFYSDLYKQSPDDGISVFVESACDVARLRDRRFPVQEFALAAITAADVETVGFLVVEVVDPELPLDRHCVLRPSPDWSISQHRKRAHTLAAKAEVIEPPSIAEARD
jgi:hypothetical protein